MKQLLIALAALLLAVPAHTQMAISSPPQGSPITLVTITGIVHPGPPGEPPLPFSLLEQIEGDPHLAQMDIQARVQTGPALHLTFTFPSVDAYRSWSQTPETRQLLDELRRRVSQVDLTVSLRRSPAAPPPGTSR